MTNTESKLRKRILRTEPWATKGNEIDKMVKRGIYIIDKNMEAGNINTINDKVIARAAFLVIDQYY